MWRRDLIILGSGLGLACGGGPTAATGFGVASGEASAASSSTTAADSSSSGSSTSAPAGSSSTSGDGSGEGTTLPPAPDFGASEPVGCQGKVDVLFVIENSNSMEPFQKRLLEAFPTFASMLAEQLGELDVQVLVTSNTFGWYMKDCSLCADPADCDPFGDPPGCGAQLTNCDKISGSARTFPVGVGASNRRCDLAGDQRYIQQGEPDVVEAFTCLAQVGYGLNTGQQFQTMVDAVSDQLTGLGRCNEGFVRDDALLAVVVVLSYADDSSSGTPESWAEALHAVKNGNKDAVTALVLATDEDVPGPICEDTAWPLPEYRARQFTEKLEHGTLASNCGDNYIPYFEAFVGEIAELCDNLIPQ